MRRPVVISASVLAFAAILALSACGSSASPVTAQTASSSPATPNAGASLASAIASCTAAGGTWSGASQTCFTAAPSPSAPAMLSVGEPTTLSDSSNATIGTLTVESANVTTQSAGGSGNSPVNGYFIVVQVKAAADPSYTSGWDVSESNFYDLVGSEHYDNGNGNAFDALTSGQANSLNTTLAAGETTDGWLSFDVPSHHGEIVYAPNANGQPVAAWSY